MHFIRVGEEVVLVDREGELLQSLVVVSYWQKLSSKTKKRVITVTCPPGGINESPGVFEEHCVPGVGTISNRKGVSLKDL